MGLNVYYQDDIRNTLLAAGQSSDAALQAGNLDDQFVRGYQEGHKAALVTIALAFGLIQPNAATESGAELVLLLSQNRREYGRHYDR